MGSKKLKAIAVKGSAKFETAHPDRLNAWRKELGASIRKSPVYLLRSKYGTLPTFAGQDSIGTLSVKNLSDVKVPEGRNLYHGAFAKNLTGINSCPGCFVHCKHDTQIVNGPYAGEKGGVVEFGSTAGLGANCGNYDADAVIKLTNVCNQYGIDVTETGYVLGYVMDWYEHGLLTVQDTDGIELKWGDWQAMLAMIHKIAHRQGFGNILAEGPLRVAKQVGKGAETYISHCKGLTRGGSPDARPFKGLALSYGTATRGACHMRGLPWIERATLGWVADDVRQRTREQFGTDDVMYPTSYNKAGVVVHYQDMATIADSLGICKFYTAVGGGTMELGEMAELCQIIFGVDVDKEELKQIAARIYNVERAFLVREGCTKNDDYLSGKYSSEPMPSGPFKGERLDKAKYTEMLEEYYRLRGWDLITGAPTKMTLDQLGIGDLLPTVDSPS